MNRIKTYDQFLNESKSNDLIDSILSAIEPNILKMIKDVEHYYINEMKREFSKLDAESTRLDITLNLLKSLEKYTLPTDTLTDINTSRGRNGTMKINAGVLREDKGYRLETDVIIASGQIQVRHYRYITKTNLPVTGRSERSKAYSARIKKLSKLEKLNTEVIRKKERIERLTVDLQRNSKLTDEDVWQEVQNKDDDFVIYTWAGVVKNGADKNYDFDESKFDKAQLDRKLQLIKSWKYFNVESKEESIVSNNKEIIKLNKKIEKEL